MSVATTVRGRTDAPAETGTREQARRGGWFYYWVAAICLVPIVVPTGPGQTALVDVLNLAALGAFTIWAGTRRRAIVFPFALPIFLILIGSLVAMVNAESLSSSLLALGQDLYLYLWFVALVNVIGGAEELRLLRLTWLWTAVAMAIVGVGLLAAHDPSALGKIVGLKGTRAAGTFYNPNMFADYLVASLFVVWSLGGQVSKRVLWSASAVLLFALVTTKSNGGLAALAGGLVAWGVARGVLGRRSSVRMLGVLSMAVALALGGWWMAAGWGIGQRSLSAIGQGSFLGRVSHSADTRLHIWGELAKKYARSPLGIGPGNSRQQRLAIGSRERPEGLMSKEAHNDYVGYLIERGPLALLGLIVLIVQAFLMALAGSKPRPAGDWLPSADAIIAAALIGGMAATSIHSFMIEKLHFRHFWLFLALLCAFGLQASVGLRDRSARGVA